MQNSIKPFFLTTIPKSGTNLLTSFLGLSNLIRKPFGERELVSQTDLLFYHHHHTDLYKQALGIELDAKTLAVTEDAYVATLKDCAEKLNAIPEGHYAFFHVPFEPRLCETLRQLGLPMVFLYRDLRDVAISMANHFLRDPKSKKHKTLVNLETDEDRYIAILAGHYGERAGSNFPLLPLSHLFQRYEGWLNEPNVLVLRYRDIIGPKGGGDAEAQLQTYRKFSDHIGLEVADSELQGRIDSIYDENAPYFVNGRRGQWESVITPRMQTAIDETFGEKQHLWFVPA